MKALYPETSFLFFGNTDCYAAKEWKKDDDNAGEKTAQQSHTHSSAPIFEDGENEKLSEHIKPYTLSSPDVTQKK